MYQSQVEFTITTVVSWDLTSVEGVSGGLTMNYTDQDGKCENVVAIPPKFKGPWGPWFCELRGVVVWCRDCLI